MTTLRYLLAYFVFFLGIALSNQVQAQSVSFFQQKLQGNCIQYYWTSGSSLVWTSHYLNTFHCPSGRMQMSEMQIKEYSMTDSYDQYQYQYTGTWKIISNGEQYQVYYQLNDGRTMYVNISIDTYGQLNFGYVWKYCGQAQCY